MWIRAKKQVRRWLDPLVAPRDRILSAISDEGIHWKREKGVRIDIGGIHNTQMAYYSFVHRPKDSESRWEMYYHSSDFQNGRWIPRILKATSSDGLNWQDSLTPAITAGSNSLNFSQTRAPFLVDFGTFWRMYFTARGSDSVLRILSAISKNRKEWKVEDGARIAPELFPLNLCEDRAVTITGVSDPSVIQLDDGRLRMYFALIKYSEWHQDIRSAVSTNGIDWKIEDGIRIQTGPKGYIHVANNPCVIRQKNGWRMYFRGADLLPLWNNIFTAFSKDSLHWNVERMALQFRRWNRYERHAVAFPFVVPLPDGRYRMYYTGYWGNLFDFSTVRYYRRIGSKHLSTHYGGNEPQKSNWLWDKQMYNAFH